jgi:alpha-glucosidase (family GH31 glycosyl hydrolase)
VPFDIADPHFTQGYFEILHHPYEKQGVDFWWLDWQQGQRIQHSRRRVAEHMDPLWWLNYLHFHDRGRDGARRPFIFSRWGGLGNQRYPIGFSGDSHVTWRTLAFQPYFTANAANVAFGWWSHDIGGHCAGVEDDELYARWVQLGVFSPILRLHSTNNPYHDRRPWGRGDDVFRVTRNAMQLRHALIPYLYSMAWRVTRTSIPLVTPLYYAHPEKEEAYQCPNEYWFGSELIAAPFVSPRHAETGLSRQTIWLPEGDWFNFFSGEYFPGGGGRWITVHGSLDEMPVLARAGGIVPMGPHVGWGGLDNPEVLLVHIFPGADGAFTLYEDDGDSTAYLKDDYCLTRLTQHWHGGRLQFQIEPVEGNARHVPTPRRYQLVLHGIRQPDGAQVEINGASQNVQGHYDAQSETLGLPDIALQPADRLTLTVSVKAGSLLSKRDRRLETCRALLWAFRLATEVKRDIDLALPDILRDPGRLAPFGNALTDAQWAALLDVVSLYSPASERRNGTP